MSFLIPSAASWEALKNKNKLMNTLCCILNRNSSLPDGEQVFQRGRRSMPGEFQNGSSPPSRKFKWMFAVTDIAACIFLLISAAGMSISSWSSLANSIGVP